METPPPNDSFQASLSPPVGGRLRSFKRDWLTNICSDNVLNIITNGYVLPFISRPNLVRAPLIQSGYKALQKELALTSCIQFHLSKNAIERVENVKSLGFYSRLFLVPKPHQRWRPVIDLSRLNTFLLVERFKMKTPESIRASPGQKRGSCGHVMALFDNHKKCAHCCEKGVGDDPCVKKLDCQICKAFTPAQIQQLATPTYRSRKERVEQKKSEVNSNATPHSRGPFRGHSVGTG